MNGRNFYSFLFIWLCISGLVTHSFAQTITTIAPTSVCPGGAVTISYTISGTFTAGNIFTAQLSDAAGSFASPAIIGSITSVSAGSVNATIPATANGAGYRIRIVSSTPAVIGAASTQALTVTKPTPPGVADISLCLNGPSSPLTASGSNLKWYDATGNLLSGAPTPSTSNPGTQTFKVSQTVGTCVSGLSTLVVTVSSPPAPPGVANLTYCLPTQDQPAQNVSALTASGSGLKWYNTDGSFTTTAPTPVINQVGTQNYSVSQTVAGCESSKSTLQVTVRTTATPTIGNATPTYCQFDQAKPLEATGETDGNLYWIPAGGTTPFPAPFPTPPTDVAGSRTYFIFQLGQNGTGCVSTRTPITVTVNPTPASPSVSPIGFCQNGPSSPLTASGSNLKWYDATGNLLSGAPTPSTSNPGTQTFKVSQTVGTCVSGLSTLVVTVSSPPAPPGVANLTYCLPTQDQPAQNVSALTASGSGLKWYNTDGSFTTTAPTPVINQVGTQNYSVSQTVAGCESSKSTLQVTVRTTATPTIGNATPTYCQFDQAKPLEATGETDGNLYWIPAGGTTPFPAPFPTPPTDVAGSRTYFIFQLGQNGTGCVSTRTPITVTVNPTPASPSVSPIGFCQNGPSSPLTASGSNLKWYDASNNLLGGAPTPGTGTVGDQVFKVSQTVGNCEGQKANLTVTIKPLPNAPGVVNRAFCLQTQDQPAQNVEALNAFGENLKWYNPDGTFTTIAPVPPISQTGVQTYSVSQTYNGCESPNRSTLLVTVSTAALPVAVKSLVTYCINDKAVPLEATGETGGSLRWIDPYGNVSNVAPTPLTLNTSIQAGGDPFYVYQIGSNGCYSGRTTIKALVNALPTLSLVPSATSINLGQRVALQLKFTSAAPFSYTLTDGRSTPTNGLIGVVNKSDTTLSFLPTSTTTYQIVTVRNSCGVGLPGNPATATIAVRVPTITTSALTQLTACVGTSLSVPFTSTGDFNTGNLFRFELVSVADTSKKFSVSGTATASPVTAPLPLTLASGQYYVRVKADNPEIAIIGSNSPTPLTIRSLATATLAGTQKIYEGYPGSLTFTFGGDGPWTITYADSVQSYSAVATASPYAAEVRPTRTTTYRLTSVANGCGTGTISGTAVITVLPLLGIDDNSLDPLVKTYPVPTTSILTVEVDLPLTRDPATLSLTTMSGRPVLQQTTRNKRHELDLTAQPSGLYLLHIQVGDRQTTRKVLKQ